MADLLILALTVFTFQNNTKIAVNIHLLKKLRYLVMVVLADKHLAVN